ncbi:protein arginine kinase [candidate division KSB1 bacterium]|nr:protein arginine kinase [candidate division KSB1 bacterium]
MKSLHKNKDEKDSLVVVHYQKIMDDLFKRPAQWLSGTGQHADIVISSRIRLARNLYDLPYTARAKDYELTEIMHKVRSALMSVSSWSDMSFFEITKLSDLDKQFFIERRLLSPYMLKSKGPGGLTVMRDQQSSVIINEEDHLRIQVIHSGLEIKNAWQAISKLDDELGEHLEYQFSDQFGYLTACPTNTGTGMRVSIFIHLPGLALAGSVEKVMKDLAPGEVTIRGFYGEGTDVLGNFFQISNQLTLGRAEDGIIQRMELVAERLIEMETEARKELLEKNRLLLEDRVYRAFGLLLYSRMINSIEIIALLSDIRLGVESGFFTEIERKDINEAMVLSQPAHLQKYYKKVLTSSQRDMLRAELIRKKLNLTIVN